MEESGDVITVGAAGDTVTVAGNVVKSNALQASDGGNVVSQSGTTITVGASGDTITVPSGATLDMSSGTMTLNSTMKNTPAFHAYLGTSYGVGNNVVTKLNCDTEVYDTDSCYDNSTNYRFTPTTAGKYFVYAQIAHGWSSNWGHMNFTKIYKNGSEYTKGTFYGNGSGVQNYGTVAVSDIIDFNGSSDYVEIFGYSNSSGTQFDGNHSFFGAFKLF